MKVKILAVKQQRPCPWAEMHHRSVEEYVARHPECVYLKDLDYAGPAERAGYPPPAHYDDPNDLHYLQQRILGGRQLMIEELQDCDLLVWLGLDTVITNMTVRFEDVMPATAHVAMHKEEAYENDAVMERNTPEAKSLMADWIQWMLNKDHQVWRDYGDFRPPCNLTYCTIPITTNFIDSWMGFNAGHTMFWHDATVLTIVCERYPEHAARIHTFFRKGFAPKSMHWRRGDFIMHTPGSSDENRMRYLTMGVEQTVR